MYFSFCRDDNCNNNGQTTWTYNQGVVLSGLGLLYNATGNATLISVAQKIADATMQKLIYSNGILKELCEPKCDNDQKLFKGIFIRHLSYLLPFITDPVHIQSYSSFLKQNSMSVWSSQKCETDGLFSIFWTNQSSNSCETSRDIASTSSVLDLFLSTASLKQQSSIESSSTWTLLGLGNCMDDRNASMTNFYKRGVSETICRTTAESDQGAIAYDFDLSCLGSSFCRIRTRSDQHQTPSGWTYEGGSAQDVTRTNKLPTASCFLRSSAI